MLKRTIIALSLQACTAGMSAAQTPEQLREFCTNPAALAEIREQISEFDVKLLDWAIKFDCPRLDLPTTPVHDSADPSREQSHTDWVYDAVYSGDGRTILSAGKDGFLGLWDTETGKLVRRIAMPAGPAPGSKSSVSYVRSATFVGNGTRLVATKDGTPVLLFDTATGKSLGELPFTIAPDDFPPRMASSKGGLLFLAGYQNDVLAVDVTSMQIRYKLSGHRGQATAVAVSDVADVVATAPKPEIQPDLRPAEQDQTVYLWGLSSGAKLAELALKGSSVDALAFSRDGAQLAVVSGSAVHVFSVKDKTLLRTIVVHPMFSVFDAAFTADGKGLLTCQSHPVLWDLATGEVVRHFGPFNDLCHAIDVSPDGKFAVTTSMASDLKIWEIATGTFHRRLGIDVKPPR